MSSHRSRAAFGPFVFPVFVVASLAFAATVLGAGPELQPLRPPGSNSNAVPKDAAAHVSDWGTSALTYVTVSGAAFVPA